MNELCNLLNDEQKATVKPIIVNCLADWNITTENPCPGFTEDKQQESTEENIFEDGAISKNSDEDKLIDSDKQELDNLLDNLMGK